VEHGAVLAWLRKGELDARGIVCRPFQKDKFRAALEEIRELTLRPIAEAIPETVRLCAESGVAVVFVPELPKTRTWGATRWLSAEKALIQLSARGKTDDQLWFTFFHEAGHILLHPKKDIFIELDNTEDSREDEANRFAADLLIPPNTWMLLRQMKLRRTTEIQLFAQKYKVAPGILVGRMQRENLIPWAHLNGLKTHLEIKAS
jgi:Zn-dependent peptidase ImmA (M78 family)